MKFVLLHGAFGSPEKNWFPELQEKLESLGQEIIAPQFPVDNWEVITKNGPSVPTQNQNLENWFKTFESFVLPKIKNNERLCFVGHSLGPLFILHAIQRFGIPLDCAIFVSPFLDRLGCDWQIDHANKTFWKTDFDFEKLKKLIPDSYVLYSDSDPYVGKNHSMLFANALGSSPVYVRKAGHMNSEVNLNEFPLVLDLCLTRLDLSLHERYLMIRQKMGAIDYVRTIKGNAIKLQAQDALDEGVFRFRYLQKGGFCTLFTGITYFWDPHSQYMQDAREAAQKGRKITRVIVVEKVSDLKNSKLREQIDLDMKAGIHIFLCPYEAIKGQVSEPDFGIWDDDYVCIVPFNNEKHVVGRIELTSNDDDLITAHTWKDIILQHSTKVSDIDRDIEVFSKNGNNRN